MKKLLSIFLIYALFFPTFVQAYSAACGNTIYFADESPSSSTAQPGGNGAPPATSGIARVGVQSPGAVGQGLGVGQGYGAALPLGTAAAQRNEMVCDSSELSPQETQNIIDLLKNGFTAKGDGGIVGIPDKDSQKDRERIGPDGNATLIIQDPKDENKATKVNVPSQKMKPSEISQFLNTSINGPFAFGVVLEDSLRTGKCKDASSPECTLTGPNLTRRNSGAGIVSDLKPVGEAFKDVKDYFSDANKVLQAKTQYTKAEEEKIRTALTIDSNGNDVRVQTASRPEKALIPNSILAMAFEAKLATNCANPSCVISTYSLFDKYFNSWMSTEMVASIFGPSAMFYTKKLFGWTGRRGFLAGVRDEFQSFLDRFRAKLLEKDTYLQKIVATRMQNRIDKYGWRDWFMKMVSGNSNGTGYHLIKTEEFQHFWGAAQEPNGFLSRIKTREEKKEFLKFLYDLRSLTRGAKTRVVTKKEDWKLAENLFGIDNPITKQKYVDYGQEFSKMMIYYDDVIGADVPEWMVRHPNLGLYNKGVNVVRPDGGSEVIDLYKEHRNFQRIVQKFAKDGQFRDFEKMSSQGFDHVFESKGDGLVYYVFDSDSVKAEPINLSYGNIKTAANNRKKVFIKDDYGEYLPYHDVSEELIRNRLTKPAQLFEGNWKEGGVISPVDFTSRLTNGRTGQNMENMGVFNTEQMINTLKERNWVSRRYFNQLDKLMAQEDELITSYFSIKGGAKWTALPYGYWWAKRGFGNEGISQYQLPETWHDIKIYPGGQAIYDYAYVDFFANEGSDTGDIFVQVLNKLPWKLLLDELSQKYNPVKNLYNMLTNSGLRAETEDLAFYMTGPEECVGCSVNITSQGLNDFKPFFFVPKEKMVSYILEDTKSETAKQKGMTLIAFGGHTNLKGKTAQGEGGTIDLVGAINGKDGEKTCAKAVEDLDFLGMNVGKKLPKAIAEKGRIGAVLSGFESISYATFLWAGVFSTAAIQIAVAPQLHGCIDTEEGYYVHYFVPPAEKKAAQANANEKSTEKVQKLVKDAKEKLFDQFNSNSGSFVQESKEKIGAELDKFVADSKDNDIVQATLRFEGQSSGQLISRELFYFWCGKGCEINAAKYRTEGREELRGVNGTNVGLDFAKGNITANGKEIVNKPDNVRLASTNLNIPAVEIPHLVTQACLESSTEKVIEITAEGDVIVLNPYLLNCIKEGIIAQTGLPLDSQKLNDVFGKKLNSVITTTHPNVKPLGDRILAEGVPRKVATGRDARISIYANKDVNLSNSNDGITMIGKLESLQFANGVIVVKPDGCFVVWLRHHEDGILSKDMVDGLKTNLERVPNNETGCPEPAINFDVLGDSASDFKSIKVEKFNTALDHQGPFTVFETPTKRYVISSERDDNGECRDHLRVIDKETGKVTDYVGNITATPDGLKIRTGDGKEHELKFSEKDGAPFVQFDGEKPELLTAAQGKNGSFYYDPEKGLWFAENANLLPLVEAFRNGMSAKVGPGGEASASAQGNVLNLQVGKGPDNGFLNLPSLPENPVVLFLFVAMLAFSFAWVQRKKRGASKISGN